MHAFHAVMVQLTYPRRTLAPDNVLGHGTIPAPLESPFLQRLDPVTVQPSANGPDVDRWDSAEDPPSRGAASNRGSQKVVAKASGKAAEDTKCVMLSDLLAAFLQSMPLHMPVLCYAMLCYAMLCHAVLCCAVLCHAVLCHATLSCAMP